IEREPGLRAAAREGVLHADGRRERRALLRAALALVLEARLVDYLLLDDGGLRGLKRVLRRRHVEGARGKVEVADALVLTRRALEGVARDERVRRAQLVVETRAEGRATVGRQNRRVEDDGRERRVENDCAH